MYFPKLQKMIFPLVLMLCFFEGVDSAAAVSDPVKNLTETAANSSLSFRYEYDALKDKVRMTGEGSACIQGYAYELEVDGISFYCDGETRWTVDSNSKEVVIETVEGLAEDIYSNPVLLIIKAEDVFDRDFESETVFNGETLKQVALRPRSGTSLVSLSLYFKGLFLRGVSAIAEDGTETLIYIRDLKKDVKKPVTSFRFDVTGLDSSWVVTDLR